MADCRLPMPKKLVGDDLRLDFTLEEHRPAIVGKYTRVGESVSINILCVGLRQTRDLLLGNSQALGRRNVRDSQITEK